jgi:nicotinate-nucleotide adenylyltransferase
MICNTCKNQKVESKMEKSARKTTSKKCERIGLLGGSFNPAHDGHVAISLFAIKRLKLDAVWWLVSPQNPLKTRDKMAPLAVRLQAARALLKPQKKIRATDIEAHMKTRYTIDTLRAIKIRFPRKKFVWLMGQDNLKSIHRWKLWQQIFLELPVAVFLRSGYSDSRVRGVAEAFFAKAELPLASAKELVAASLPAWVMLDNPLNSLSASQIRQQPTSKTNPSNEGVKIMVAKKPAAKKKVAKKPAKKAAKKPAKKAVKKAVKKPAKKTAKKKAAKK